jgi:hypothetical protein
MQNLSGQFQIKDWQESTQQEYATGKRSLANVKLEYTGDIVGDSELQYLLSYQVNGSADFVGFEQISANIDGNAGCITLQHMGRFEAGIASSQFTVMFSEFDKIPTGSKGEFKSGENGLADYSITLE